MNRPATSGLDRVILILDALLIVISMALTSLVHGVLPLVKEPPPFESYAALVYLTCPLWLLLIHFFGLHRLARLERAQRQSDLFVDLLKLHVLGLVCLVILIFATNAVVNRSLVGIFIVGTFLLLYVERSVIAYRLRYQRRAGFGLTRILLVGAPSDQMAAFVRCAREDDRAPQFVGYLSDDDPGSDEAAAGDDGEAAAFPARLGGLDDIERVLHDEPVDQVLFFSPASRPEDAAEAVRTCEMLGVAAGFFIEMARPFQAAPRVVDLHNQPFITYELAPKAPESLAVKHGIDAVAAALGLLVLAPLLLLVALAILVSMGRPIFFLQERAGLYGRRFRMWKFRTMVAGAEQRRDELLDENKMSGPVFKADNDPRVTALGRVLRRASIDELPQLFNVLAGTMSLVGPRPLPLKEDREIWGLHRRRLSMRPGITGLWQISGRNEVDFEDWMRLDLQYIDSWSHWLDLKILVRTVAVVLRGRGAR